MSVQPKSEKLTPWPLWPTLGLSCVIFLVFLATSVIAATGFAIVEIAQNPILQEPGQEALLIQRLEENGDLNSISSILSGFAGTVAVVWFARMRQGFPLKKYLNLHGSSFLSFLIWNGLMYALLVTLGHLADRLSQTSDYLEKAFASAGNLPLLYIAVVIMAPVFEELFFRGFMFKGLEKTKVGPWGTIVLTSFVWAVIHLQYSAFFIGVIFTLGLLLGYARLKSQSVWVPISMHALNNLLAMLSVGMVPIPFWISGLH